MLVHFHMKTKQLILLMVLGSLQNNSLPTTLTKVKQIQSSIDLLLQVMKMNKLIYENGVAFGSIIDVSQLNLK